jgi:type IV secretion system protein VirD4
MGQDTWIINPFERHKHYLEGLPQVGFNPMAGLNPDDLAFVEKCDRLTAGAFRRSRGGGADDNAAYFQESAKAMAGGIIGAVVYLRPEDERHLVTVFDIIANPDRFFAFVDEALATRDDFLVSRLSRFAAKSAKDSKEVEGILSTARTELNFLSGGAVRRCLSAKPAFRWRDLKKRPTTVFYMVELGFAETCEKLSRILMSDVLNDFALPEPDSVPVLALCDEYRSTLANMSLMTEALSYSAGLGLQLCPIWQDANQIVDATSANSWQTMIANCGVQVYFAPRENFTASYVSEALGETEVTTTSKTVNYPADTDWDKADSVRPQISVQHFQAARRLMLPQEVRRLSRDEMVILAEDVPDPFIARRRSYRETPEFEGLYGPNPFYPDAGIKPPGPGWTKRSTSFLFGSGRKG